MFMVALLLLWFPMPTQHGLLTAVHAESSRVPSHTLDEILEAIRATESGGWEDGGRHATGDGGRAIGPFQIHRAHWQDTGLPGRYEDCREPSYARREVVAYWERWCPEALERRDARTLARVHNGGPDGARKSATLMYWATVQAALERVALRRADVPGGLGYALRSDAGARIQARKVL